LSILVASGVILHGGTEGTEKARAVEEEKSRAAEVVI
jgi:hypothetical protein